MSDRVQAPIVLAPKVPAAKAPADILGFILDNHGAELRKRAITFGEIFPPGKLRKGTGLRALINGHEVPVQLDAKATNSDGTVRMGIVTIAPDRVASGLTPVMLIRGPPEIAAPLDISKLQDHSLSVEVRIGSRLYHLDPTRLVVEGINKGSASYWLNGPLTTEARTDVPLERALHITFDVRMYVDGSAATDIAFKNDYAFETEGGPIDYAVTIKEGDSTALKNQLVHQPQYTHWHIRVWNSVIPNVNIVHDVANLERNAVLDYDLRTGVSNSVLEREARNIRGLKAGILGNAGLTMYMGTTGDRPEIGPTTMANAIWILTQDQRAATFALEQANAAGSIPWHFFDRKLGDYRTTTAFPNLWEDALGGTMGTTGLTQQVTPYSPDCRCWTLDQAHQPDLSFVPYILTGSRFYLDQLKAQAAWDILSWHPHYRQGARGIVVFFGEVRAQAWDMRGIVNAAWILPDDDPLKRYFTQIEANNFSYLWQEIRKLGQGDVAGWIPGAYGTNDGAIAPWQQDYFASIMILAAKREITGARRIVEWESNFLAGRFLSAPNGLSPFDGVAYNLYVWRPPSWVTGAYQTWAEVAHATASHGQSFGAIREWPKNRGLAYIQAARGILAELVFLTDSQRTKSAYEWLIAHSPKNIGSEDLENPTWNLSVYDH